MKSLLTLLYSSKLENLPSNRLHWLPVAITCSFLAILSSLVNFPSNAHPDQINQTLTAQSKDQLKAERWIKATPEEQQQTWNYILNSPLAIAALNQLAIEGFISPTCPKTIYIDQESGGFQTLLQVRCSKGRGVSISTSYQEMQVVFSRFEDNIESFQIQRIEAVPE